MIYYDKKAVVETITKQEKSFKLFLKQFLLDKQAMDLIDRISQNNTLYIYSGVIRDFLIGHIDYFRDIDIVIKTLKELPLHYSDFKKLQISKNSFGGYKLKIDQLTIDAWFAPDTWGIKREGLKSCANSLINTAFFNFSAIVYNYNKEQFIFDDKFVHFFATREMDIVYAENPNIPLCIVNAFYYKGKYRFGLSRNLMNWVRNNYRPDVNYEKVQLRHFGRIVITNSQLNQLIES